MAVVNRWKWGAAYYISKSLRANISFAVSEPVFIFKRLMKCVLFLLWGVFALKAFVFQLRAAELPPAATRPIDFVKDVQPILSARCYECHSAKKQKADLRWDVKSVATKGGEHGAAIVPGKSAESLMI